jgi:hypothetical protein
MRKMNKKNQRGFVGIVFLAIALIGIVIAAIAAMSRSSSSGTADQAAKTNASIVIKQASDFKSGMDRMIVNGVTPSAITFDATVGTGLFDPSAGAQYAVRHVPPGAVFSTPPTGTPTFYYNQHVKLPNIGSTSVEDYVVTLGPLTLTACQQINHILYSDSLTATPATSSGAIAAWTTSPTAIDDSTATSATNYSSRPEGCVAAGGSYVYYKALVEN